LLKDAHFALKEFVVTIVFRDVFIIFYAIPALCSGIGSKKLDRLSEKKSTVNQDYISLLSSFIAGSRVIKNYHSQNFFYTIFQKKLFNKLISDFV